MSKEKPADNKPEENKVQETKASETKAPDNSGVKSTDKISVTIQKVPRNRFGCWFVVFNNLLLFSIIAVILLITCYLPGYIQEKVLPELSSRYGLKDFSGNVRRVGLTGADLGQVKFGDETGSSVEIASVRIDYSLSELLFKRTLKINRLTLSGLDINCIVKGRRLDFSGFDPAAFVKAGLARQPGSSISSGVQFDIGELVIEKAVATIIDQGNAFRVPLDFILTPEKNSWEQLTVSARLYPQGELVRLSGSYDVNKRIFSMKLQSDFELGHVSPFLRTSAGCALAGRAGITVDAEMVLRPFMINRLKAEGEVNNFQLSGNRFAITGIAEKRISHPVKFSVNGSGSHFRCLVSGLRTDSEYSPVFRDIAADIDFREKGIECRAESAGELSKLPAGINYTLDYPVKISQSLDLKYLYSGKWNAEFFAGIAGNGSKPGVKAICKDKIISLYNLEIRSKVAGQGALYKGNVRLDTGRMNAVGNELIAGADKLTASGSFTDVDYDIQANLHKFAMNSEAFSMKTSELKGLFKAGKKGLSAVASFKKAIVESGRYQLRSNDAAARIPLAWTDGAADAKGYLKLNDLSLRGFDLGELDWNLKAFGKSIGFSGKLNLAPMPDMNLNCSGSCAKVWPPKFNLKIKLPQYTIRAPFEFGMYFPSLDGISIKGNVAADAVVSHSDGKTVAQGKLQLSKSNFIHKRLGLKITGADLKLKLNDLIRLSSAAGQTLKFKTMSLKGFSVTDGSMEFQLLPDSFRLEESSCSWCGGTLKFPATVFRHGQQEYRMKIACDRLKLADVISRSGISKAESNGLLNGQIPLVYNRKNGVSISGGYLASIPGNGGNIRLADTSTLTKGLNKNSVEYAQLDLTAEALHNFNYNWARLEFNLVNKMIGLHIQFDGKSAKPLPFAYDDKRGCFIRVPGPAKLSQGLQLDLNMDIPMSASDL